MAAKKKHGLGRLYKRYGGKEYKATSPVRGKFYLEYRINGIRKREPLFDLNNQPITTLQEAEKARERLLAPLLKMRDKEKLEVIKARIETTEDEYQELIVFSHPPLKLSEMWQTFLNTHEYFAGQATLDGYNCKVKRFIKWLSGYDKSIKLMRDVSPETAKAFMLYLFKKYSGNTYNKYLQLLGHIYDVLAKDAQIKNNPFSGIRKVPSRKIKAQTNSRRMLTLEELRTVVERAEGDLKILFCIGIYTGLRLGDCATLRWPEIDFDRRLITRVPLKTQNTSGKVVKVGLPNDLLVILAEHSKQTQTKSGYVLPRIKALYEKQNASALTKVIQAHFTACGIETNRPGTGKFIDPKTGKKVSTGKRAITEVGFHSLRHTFVSLHAEAGTPQGVIRDLVGHGNVAMTAHYEHISDTTVIQCAEKLPSLTGTELTSDKKLPGWVKKALLGATAENWTTVRDELLAHA